ncbi:MAG TPA: DUF1127 domain-containing protein [Acetobacteraceae bacterium]|nr:DUF1127 domain-containing protein [Acetobacteraceae bacterium]
MSVHQASEWLRAHDVGLGVADPAGLVGRFGEALAAWRRRARERRQLGAMTGRELRDIGITPGDLNRVFGPEFAKEYASRGRDI